MFGLQTPMVYKLRFQKTREKKNKLAKKKTRKSSFFVKPQSKKDARPKYAQLGGSGREKSGKS
jgi:hypothetical protein